MTPENAQGATSDPNTKPRVHKRLSWHRLGSALAGSVLFGVIIPCFLTWIALFGGANVSATNGLETVSQFQWNVVELLVLIAFALLFCSPGAMVLSSILFFIFRKLKCVESESERELIQLGVISGALVSVLNFPGFAALFFLEQYPLAWLRIVLLFVITGATCGAWTAWQAYREAHPERGFLPRFTMITLLILAISWGLLLMVFMPREKPNVNPDPNANQMV